MNEIRMSPDFRVTLLRGLFLGVVLGAVAWIFGSLNINPGVGEGADLDPQSFRYRLGVWLEYHDTPFFTVACWPVIVLAALGVHHISAWASILGCIIAGIGWVWLWHQLVLLRRQLARIIQR